MFTDRVDAGGRLGKALDHLRGDHPVVLGLPRGGVVVAAQVAKALDAPLDVILVRKLGLPTNPEVAMGAIGEGGARVLDAAVLAAGRPTGAQLAAIEAGESRLLDARLAAYRGGRPRVELAGRTAIVVDDGVATGSTARVAREVASRFGASRLVLAVPVGPPDLESRVGDYDEVVCLLRPRRFAAVGAAYESFGQTTDEEVVQLLEEARRRAG